jgi:hypothetical protein
MARTAQTIPHPNPGDVRMSCQDSPVHGKALKHPIGICAKAAGDLLIEIKHPLDFSGVRSHRSKLGPTPAPDR